MASCRRPATSSPAGCPPDFVRFWDRWLARHLAARLPDALPLHFVLAHGPLRATGTVLASADRAGRRFPLTLAAPGSRRRPTPRGSPPSPPRRRGRRGASSAPTPSTPASSPCPLAAPAGRRGRIAA